MDINAAFPSNWIKAADLAGREVTVTMEEVRIEAVGGGQDSEELPVLFFQGQSKGLILNKTNGRTIAGLYGSETEGWRGRAVTLFPTTTTYGAETRDCVRIKAPVAAPAPAPAPTPPPPPEPTPPPEGAFF